MTTYTLTIPYQVCNYVHKIENWWDRHFAQIFFGTLLLGPSLFIACVITGDLETPGWPEAISLILGVAIDWILIRTMVFVMLNDFEIKCGGKDGSN